MNKGFTLIEVLIATAIFTMVVIAFVGIFIIVAGVQVRQVSSSAVADASQLLLQKIQYYIESSSYVSTTPDLAVSTLTLRMPSSSIDPTIIMDVNGTVYIQQGSGVAEPLTARNVTISNLSFTRHQNPPGHDSVSVDFTVNYATLNAQQMFSQALSTAVARVSAATFDSGVYPVVSGNGSLGSQSQAWQSLNGILYFNGTNVGINQVSPQQALEVNGGIRLNTAASEPSCGASSRGTLWYLELAPATNDELQICTENASGTYGWLTL